MRRWAWGLNVKTKYVQETGGQELRIAWQDHAEAIPASMNVVIYRYHMLARLMQGRASIPNISFLTW